MLCENCVYNVYDENDDCYYCEASLDEDEFARLSSRREACPYFRLDDEYGIVRKQN